MNKLISILVVLFMFVACNSQSSKNKVKEEKSEIVEHIFKVGGMTCDHCEMSICKGVNQLAGIDSVSANHEDSTAFVRFNSAETNLHEIAQAIEKRGYIVQE